MDYEIAALPLIRTRLHRPRIFRDLIVHPHLPDHLTAHNDRPSITISTPAGYGKTTLLVQWLDQAPYRAAWLSLDQADGDPIVLPSYFVTTRLNPFCERAFYPTLPAIKNPSPIVGLTDQHPDRQDPRFPQHDSKDN